MFERITPPNEHICGQGVRSTLADTIPLGEAYSTFTRRMGKLYRLWEGIRFGPHAACYLVDPIFWIPTLPSHFYSHEEYV